ncbi:BAG_1a_G0014260.mRNA.1.CDS.1 [Saccharomyces cerevisiae]|nr:SX2_G0000710.mRNA.1.CDS.1 [Saccharomyces cerevisiae]CAI4408368.1 BAK_1a_G0014260.mRNA.1.CDS.1 [Saccharomyces cerevisiae]CAI4411757.1 BAI_1a_G0014280.mRNA.1.CDS.1 [Saccharomyces cerevisiae]CAI4428936.1 BAG_1a_G0014260.mRNA.1.CDS.1 [Saccharomyces cerevisiae]CAI7097822.1 BAI_1a_G0014280.mRNA.1.CDS.1 [Saccharomyces cerevisiae]
MRTNWNFFFCILLQAIFVVGTQTSRTLVLYDQSTEPLEEYSVYLKDLEQRNYKLEYLDINSTSTTVDLYDKEQRLFDNIIVFPTKGGKNLARQIPVKQLIKFFENEGNILCMSSPGAVPNTIRLFLNELGIYPSPKGHVIRDYFSPSSEELVVSSNHLLNKYVYNAKKSEDFVFGESSAALLENREQIVPILNAPRTSFTESKGKCNSWTSGSQGFLVVGFQNLNNARLVWIGSSDFLKNKNQDSNQEFAKELLKWTFNEKSVIKSVHAVHSHADGTSYDEEPYKIKDKVIYSVGFSEWNGEEWLPHIADDIQFELRQVDPYYRLTLSPSGNDSETQYYTTGEFILPDRHGVFTFLTDYRKIGLSFTTDKDVKAIRHLANDEYPRSWEISNSWVYISAICGVIVAWIFFVVSFVTTSSVGKKLETFKKTN